MIRKIMAFVIFAITLYQAVQQVRRAGRQFQNARKEEPSRDKEEEVGAGRLK